MQAVVKVKWGKQSVSPQPQLGFSLLLKLTLCTFTFLSCERTNAKGAARRSFNSVSVHFAISQSALIKVEQGTK